MHSGRCAGCSLQCDHRDGPAEIDLPEGMASPRELEEEVRNATANA